MIFRQTLVCASPIKLVIAKSTYNSLVRISQESNLNLETYRDFIGSTSETKIHELRNLITKAGNYLLETPQPINQKSFDLVPGIPPVSKELDIPAPCMNNSGSALSEMACDPGIIALGGFSGDGSYIIVSAILNYVLRYSYINELAGYAIVYYKAQVDLNAYDYSISLNDESADVVAGQVDPLSDEICYTQIVRSCEVLQNPEYATQCGISPETFASLQVLPTHVDPFPYN